MRSSHPHPHPPTLKICINRSGWFAWTGDSFAAVSLPAWIIITCLVLLYDETETLVLPECHTTYLNVTPLFTPDVEKVRFVCAVWNVLNNVRVKLKVLYEIDVFLYIINIRAQNHRWPSRKRPKCIHLQRPRLPANIYRQILIRPRWRDPDHGSVMDGKPGIASALDAARKRHRFHWKLRESLLCRRRLSIWPVVSVGCQRARFRLFTHIDALLCSKIYRRLYCNVLKWYKYIFYSTFA